MKIIYNNVLPFRGFIAMLTIFTLWVRMDYKGDKRLDAHFFNHEKIHSYQQIEIWVTSIVVTFPVCLLSGLSFWWILATPAIPLLVYVLCWIVEIALPPYNSAYRNICFESEAIPAVYSHPSFDPVIQDANFYLDAMANLYNYTDGLVFVPLYTFADSSRQLMLDYGFDPIEI